MGHSNLLTKFGSKMNEFKFENTLKLTESQYLAMWVFLPATRRRGLFRLVALVAFGVVLLLTPYTLLRLLGLVFLGIPVIVFYVPRLLIPFGVRSSFRQHRYLQDSLTYGVSEQKLWIKGPHLDASVGWPMLVTWRKEEGLLVLSPSGIPPLYYSINRLQEEGLYDRVIELAKRYGKEFQR